MAVGAPLEDHSARVVVLLAAMPSTSKVTMLAEHFEADSGRIARIILYTTAAALVTFSLLLAVTHS